MAGLGEHHGSCKPSEEAQHQSQLYLESHGQAAGQSPTEADVGIGEGSVDVGMEQHDQSAGISTDVDAGGDDQDGDADSGYGYSLPDAASISSRVSQMLPRHEYRHGRRYHGLHAGSYNFPNDDLEQARLDMLHYVFTRLMNDELCLAPIAEDATVLDIGTGTGAWPIHFGDSYPAAKVVGVDLSPIQPQWVPANVSFAVDDVELDWTDDMYDYIHCRYMAASIRDWPALIQRAFQHLRPGGWLELQESVNVPYSFPRGPDPRFESGASQDGDFNAGVRIPLDPKHPVARLMDGLSTACDSVGRSLNPAPSFRQWCQDTGFQQVRQYPFFLPLGTWPSDSRHREIGSLMAVNFTDGVEGFTAALFADVLGWSTAEVDNLNEEVQAAAMSTRDARPIFDFLVVTAQKPM